MMIRFSFNDFYYRLLSVFMKEKEINPGLQPCRMPPGQMSALNLFFIHQDLHLVKSAA